MKPFHYFSLLALFVGSMAYVQPVRAVSGWSEPLLLNDESPFSPIILADGSDGVHVLWGSNGANETRGAIFYRRLVNGSWSETVDILAPPIGHAAIYPSAVIDAQGYIHLVWVSEKLYYSRAHLTQALDPRGWSTPYQMTNYAVTNGVLQLGFDGSLVVLFGSRGSNPAIYLLKSDDGGDLWHIAVQVSSPQGNSYPLTCSLAVDSLGRLHAVWAETLHPITLSEDVRDIPPAGVYYARSDDGGAGWTYLHQIARGEQGDPAIGVDAQDRIHLFWSGSGDAAGKYHSMFDQQLGEWHDGESILPGSKGLLGPASLGLDSSECLHIAISTASQTASSQESPGEIVMLSWRTGQWGERYQVSQSVANAQIEHSQPALAVSGGDTLHLVWIATELESSPQENNPSQLWYAVRQLSSPHIEGQPVPSLATPLATTIPEQEPTLVIPTLTPWVVDNSGFLPQQAIWYRQVPVVIGCLLSFTVLVVILRISLKKRIHAR